MAFILVIYFFDVAYISIFGIRTVEIKYCMAYEDSWALHTGVAIEYRV